MEAFAAAAFAAGLLGGVHCVGMCGGIVGALSAGSRGPLWRRCPAVEATMGIALGGIPVHEAEGERLVSERVQEDQPHDRMHRVEMRLGRVDEQRDGQPAPSKGDVGQRAEKPEPSGRLPLPRLYQHETKQ